MDDQPPVDDAEPAPKASFQRKHVKAGWRDRLAVTIAEGKALGAISKTQSGSSRGGGLERVIAELKGALRAAEQARDSEANVDGLRNHSAQHAHQAWLLLTGSIPERISGRCDCAL